MYSQYPFASNSEVIQNRYLFWIRNSSHGKLLLYHILDIEGIRGSRMTGTGGFDGFDGMHGEEHRCRMHETQRQEFHNSLDTSVLLGRSKEREEDVRGAYFRDTTAIIHSYAFRRLKHKTQVFFAPKNDHICTRIEHVLHVSSIAAAICRGLDLDADLAWAIGLGHDLGHTPFGHVGETILDELSRDYGGFVHELYSLKVVDDLANYGKGLNLTYAVRDGIVSHCGEKFEQFIVPDESEKVLELYADRTHVPSTWEGTVVRMSDKIAYLGRDIEDAVQLNIIAFDDIPAKAAKVLGRKNREIINTLVQDLIESSKQNHAVGFSDRVYHAVCELKRFNYERIYNTPLLTNYHNYFARVLKILHEYLLSLFHTYGYDGNAYKQEKNIPAARFGDYISKMKQFYCRKSESGEHEFSSNGSDGSSQTAHTIVLDYIAGMTDSYALECIQEILIPYHMHEQFDRFLLEHD